MEIVQIRSLSEIEDFIDIYVKIYSGPPYNETWTPPGREVLADVLKRSKGYCFRAVEKGRTLGIIMCSVSKWNDGIHLYIDDLAVDPSHEGTGIGNGLVEFAISRAKSEGMVGVELNALDNSRAFRFWKAVGFDYSGYKLMHRKLV